MKFATAKQLVVLTIVTCVGLFALDYWKNPQLWHRRTVASGTAAHAGAYLTLWMNHLCCTTCMDDVRAALKDVPGIDAESATGPKDLIPQEVADKMTTSMPDYGNAVDVVVTDLQKLDFVTLDRALREKGFVAGRMELGGVPHFRLEATVNHTCCGSCRRASTERIEFLKTRGMGGQFAWLDSVDVDYEHKTITAFARYVEPGKTVDVTDLMMGLNDLGYAPLSVHAEVGESQQLTPHAHAAGD